LESIDSAGLVATDLERHHDKIRAIQRRPLAGMGGDLRRHAHRGDHLVGHQRRLFQPGAVDVHQCDQGIAQGSVMQNVTDDVLHKDRRACADKGNLDGHWLS